MINKMKFVSKKNLAIATLCLAIAPLAAQPRTVRIGMILDGPLLRGEHILPLFHSEITSLLSGEFKVEFPESKTVVCDLTAPVIRQALDRLLADPQVDLILLLGGIASHEVAQRGPLPKPVIAIFVADPKLQGLPQQEGTSGVKNLNYLNDADADAVYVTPLLQISQAEFELLVAGINQRRLPSFSYLGRTEVEAGLLAAYAPNDDMLRRARRVAINIQRILKGENAGDIPVDFASATQLTINMATARAIGFYPNWRTLTEAELIHQARAETGRTLSLIASVEEAVRVNLDLLAANKQVEVAYIAMNRILNRPLEEPFNTEETAIDDSSLLTGEQRLFGYFANAQTFGTFRDFMVEEGLRAAHELQQLDAALAAQKRAKSASSRAFWMPSIALQAGLTNVFHRGGAGATALQLPASVPITLPEQQDLFWNAGVQVSLPLFTGLDRIAVNQQAAVELERLELERQSTALALSQRIRSALHVAGASYAGIEQARAAAEAARKNLELVTEAYSSGAVSIITLIDAQSSTLVAYEAAANAVYGFLIDLMSVERGIGQFYFLRTEQEKQAYFNRLEDFYRKAGVRL
ncbi:MAG: TolC family protein [bacterium]